MPVSILSSTRAQDQVGLGREARANYLLGAAGLTGDLVERRLVDAAPEEDSPLGPRLQISTDVFLVAFLGIMCQAPHTPQTLVVSIQGKNGNTDTSGLGAGDRALPIQPSAS